MDYQEMENEFKALNGNEVVLGGMTNASPQVVSAKRMEAIFSNGEVAYVAKCVITSQKTPNSNNPQHKANFQQVLSKHGQVFDEIPPQLPPKREFEHTIELEEGAKPIITTPYRHPKNSRTR